MTPFGLSGFKALATRMLAVAKKESEDTMGTLAHAPGTYRAYICLVFEFCFLNKTRLGCHPNGLTTRLWRLGIQGGGFEARTHGLKPSKTLNPKP